MEEYKHLHFMLGLEATEWSVVVKKSGVRLGRIVWTRDELSSCTGQFQFIAESPISLAPVWLREIADFVEARNRDHVESLTSKPVAHINYPRFVAAMTDLLAKAQEALAQIRADEREAKK